MFLTFVTSSSQLIFLVFMKLAISLTRSQWDTGYLAGPSGTGTNPGVRNMELPVPPTKEHKGRGRNSGRGGIGGGKGGDKGSKSSNPPPAESAPDTETAAESTATDRPDILDLSTKDLEA